MESLASTLFTGNGNMDWMSLAGKMLRNLKEQPGRREPEKRKKTTNIPPEAKPRPPRKPTHTSVHHSVFPVAKSSLAATASQFEFLRMQLIRQLVVYQKQLMALRIPIVPEPLKTQNCLSNKNNLNYQQAVPYRNNHTLGKSMALLESSNLKKNKTTKPEKLIKRKSKSKKTSQLHDLNRQNIIMPPKTKEMNGCNSNQYFTRGTLSNNVQFPYDQSGLSSIPVPAQFSCDSNAMCQKCLGNRNKTCKKKKAASKPSTKHRGGELQKRTHAIVNKTCVLNDSKVLSKSVGSDCKNIRG